MARNWLIVGLTVGDAKKDKTAKDMCEQTKTLILDSFEYLKQYSNLKNVALVLNRNRFLNHLKNESEEYKELTKELFDRIICANYFNKSDKHAVCYGGPDMDLFSENRTALDCAAKVCCDCPNKFVCTHTCYWRFLLRTYKNKEKIFICIVELFHVQNSVFVL